MNQKLSSRAVTRCLCLGALLSSAALASADTLVTFQVDMSVAAQNGFSTSDTVFARGTFDGWSTPGSQLTNNPGGSNPYLYSGTFDDTADANGNVMDWQFVYTNGANITYSSQADGDNYCFLLPATSGASAVTPTVFWDDDGPQTNNNVTFQVDMAEQINSGTFDPANGDTVYVQGNYTGWGDNVQLTNDPSITVNEPGGVMTSDVYVGTAEFTLGLNAPSEYKIVYNNSSGDHYEGPAKGDPDNSGNRFFYNAPVNGAQTLPIVSYSDVPYSNITVTNNVTFEIDMSVQEAVGAFNAASNTVEIHGDFNNWVSPITMTNDLASSDTNIYSTVIQYIGAPGTTYNYKYVIQPGTEWENVSTPSGNRQFVTGHTNGDFVLGPAFFSFQDPGSLPDFVTEPTMVTFTVNMTNATQFPSGPAFDPSSDTVDLNGLNGGINNSFWTWGFDNAPGEYQMTQIGSSLLYSVTVPVNRGQPLELTYKYGIDGEDNEAGQGDNHTRYIRSLGSYTMPTDVFGSQGLGTSSEPSFGDFTITKSGNNVALSWLGRPGVHLQTAASLTPPVTWTPDVNTDGTNLIVAPGGMASTNYTTGAGNKFYELVRP